MTPKACKRSQTFSPVDLEKSGEDQDSFRKRQMHRKTSVTTIKRKSFAVANLIDGVLSAVIDMATSRTKWKSGVVTLQTYSPNSSLAHKHSSRDDDRRKGQNNNHRKGMVLVSREELSWIKKRLADAERLAQYFTSTKNLRKEECKRVIKRPKESIHSSECFGEKNQQALTSSTSASKNIATFETENLSFKYRVKKTLSKELVEQMFYCW